MMPIRVLIIAGDPLARAGLSVLLAGNAQSNVVGQTAPRAGLVTEVQTYQPDALLWDLGWNPTTNLEVLADLTEAGPPVLALLAEETSAAAVWATGVQALLLREAPADLLVTALVTSARGLIVLDPAFTSVLSRPANLIPPEPFVEALTTRELEVLRGLAEGLSNKLIARNLAISEHTVKFHVNAILGKLGAQSRTEAVVRATRAGLILL
jgi:two-component system, NarL family, nitrate/nitrite response regulator NarL